jgi:hypothetical protein
VDLEKNFESKKQEKGLSPANKPGNSSSMAKSKSKEKKSLTDLNNLVNQITNRRYIFLEIYAKFSTLHYLLC